jgi:hypothetical protein
MSLKHVSYVPLNEEETIERVESWFEGPSWASPEFESALRALAVKIFRLGDRNGWHRREEVSGDETTEA